MVTRKNKIIAAIALAGLGLFLCAGRIAARYVIFSITPSAGARFFIWTPCPRRLARWQCVEVVPRPHDPILPHPEDGYAYRLVKHIGCLPGETIIRHGLDFWCLTRHKRLLSMGRTKLRAWNGKKLVPFTYTPGKKSAEYRLSGKEVFLVGDLTPESYDSRYFGPLAKTRIVSCLKSLF